MTDRLPRGGSPGWSSRPSREGRSRRRDGRLRHRARAAPREAGYEVVIGSRDAERARAAAAELGVEEQPTRTLPVRPTSSSSRRRRRRRWTPPQSFERRSARRPFSRSRRSSRSRPTASCPPPRRRRSPHDFRRFSTGRSSRAYSSRRATSARTRRPTRTCWCAATTPNPEQLCSSSPSESPRAARSTAGRSRAPSARGPHRSDREREQALQGTRRRAHHRRRLRRVRACGESPRRRSPRPSPRDPGSGAAGAPGG